MITADTLKTLTTFTAHALSMALEQSGYKGNNTFESAEFVGITNAGQYCYGVTYMEHGELEQGKVFLTYDPIAGKVKADY
jgi:hypothetical protein